MTQKKAIIARKIELKFNTNDPQQRHEYYKSLYRWRDICVKAANRLNKTQSKKGINQL